MSNKNPSPKTRFKKGQVANARGAGAHDPVKRALKQLTIVELREIIECALTGNLKDLEAITRDSDAPAIKVGVARSLLNAVRNGDWKTLDAIVGRIVGQMPDRLEVVAKAHVAVEGSARESEEFQRMLADPECFEAISKIERFQSGFRPKIRTVNGASED